MRLWYQTTNNFADEPIGWWEVVGSRPSIHPRWFSSIECGIRVAKELWPIEEDELEDPSDRPVASVILP